MKDCTEIAFVLDRSGSMGSCVSDTIGGFNRFLEEQKKVPGEAKFTLVLFDHEYLIVNNGINLQDVKPLNNDTYSPRGTTALLDAVGRTINEIGGRLKDTPESERPNKVVVVVLTDGQENASHEFNKEKIKQMITHQTEKYNWQFLYLSADMNAVSDAMSYGIVQANISYCSNGISNDAVYLSTSRSLNNYRTNGQLDNWTGTDVSKN